MAYRIKRKLFKSESYSVFKDISFDLQKGEILGIIGRNGVGKSTLLKLAAGIYNPTSGTVIRKSDRISLLSLSPGFDAELSGLENALLASITLGASYREAQRVLPSIAEFSELGDFIHKPVKTYSSGMRARLGFSVAIMMDTDVLLIDEVLGVGDRIFRKKAEEALLSRMSSDMSVLFVSHSESQIARVCNRVIWIENGCIVAEGSAKEVLNKYKSG